jgi:hypothetical protein
MNRLHVLLVILVCPSVAFGGRVYVITSGFVKKAGKTDPRELQRAIRLMREVRGDKR